MSNVVQCCSFLVFITLFRYCSGGRLWLRLRALTIISIYYYNHRIHTYIIHMCAACVVCSITLCARLNGKDLVASPSSQKGNRTTQPPPHLINTILINVIVIIMNVCEEDSFVVQYLQVPGTGTGSLTHIFISTSCNVKVHCPTVVLLLFTGPVLLMLFMLNNMNTVQALTLRSSSMYCM